MLSQVKTPIDISRKRVKLLNAMQLKMTPQLLRAMVNVYQAAFNQVMFHNQKSQAELAMSVHQCQRLFKENGKPMPGIIDIVSETVIEMYETPNPIREEAKVEVYPPADSNSQAHSSPQGAVESIKEAESDGVHRASPGSSGESV